MPTSVACVCAALVLLSGALSALEGAPPKNVTLIPAGSVWRFSADGTLLDANWRDRGFDDSHWGAGIAELGYGDGGEVTLITPPVPAPITSYFRHTFEIPVDPQFTACLLRIVRDDGAVVYVNGTEVFRTNMPDGPVEAGTLAVSGVEFPFEGNFLFARIPATALVRGTNVVAVEIHQATAQNIDLSFDLELTATALARPAFVTRGPYLQNGSPSAVTVKWRTDVPTGSHVRFGPSLNNQNGVVIAGNESLEHEITVDGLTPDSEYFYTIGDGVDDLEGGADPAPHRFRTAPPPGAVKPVHMWILGDSGTGGDGTGRVQAVRNAYLRSPSFRPPDVWLMLGDNAYYFGADAEYQAAVFDVFRTLLPNTVLWSTLGNHETLTALGAPYFDIFTLPKSGEAGGLASGTESYYAFDYANIHFICLDSMLSDRRAGSAMLSWLEADLTSTMQQWIIAFWHHPPYTKGSHDSDFEIELREMRENVLPVLEAGGVDLVLCGHSHVYERSFLVDGHYGTAVEFEPRMIKDAGDGREDGFGVYGKEPGPHAGAVYVVNGSSGQTSGGQLNHPVMFRSLNELGSMIIDVNGDRLDAQFLNASGVVADQFTISKAPLVTLTATQPMTMEPDASPGLVTITRSRRFADALPITLMISGSAKAGKDYTAIAGPFMIPAGEPSITLPIVPLSDGLFEGRETVVLSAAMGAGYRVHRDSRTATVFIKDRQMELWRASKFGADANDPAIAGDDADPDGDLRTNAAEFIAGSEPRDRRSFFAADFSFAAAGAGTIRFVARANRSYSVLCTNALDAGPWQKLYDVEAEPADREIVIVDTNAAAQTQRFYRVVAPRDE
jgi:3',5'-cyclic AMP phosphodiesterase CpdA